MKASFWSAMLLAAAVGVSSSFVSCPTASASISTEVVKTGNQDSQYPVVHIKDKAAVEAAINADIRSQIEDMRNRLDYSYDEEKVSYKLKYEGKDYVSLVLCFWTYNHGAAHGMPYYRGVTYSRANGARMSIRDFVRIGSDDAWRIYNQTVFSGSGKVLTRQQLFRDYASQPLSGNFYLAGRGQVALIYQPYQLAAFAYGMTSIILPASLVEELNEKNP
ncbi:hypothetical protein [uncultured Mitsuokella sp.]|uniref:hypothetical protein n=1 Tax=uncultured Mitsuokella sp. TaxID=453120 RepID=UPI0026DCC885|nr:hypothetical protein [uncultured Mitsuokella sp.]